MELWKWDDATEDFFFFLMTQPETFGLLILTKALHHTKISITWAKQFDSGRLASVHTTGKMSRAASTRSIRECKIRIETFGGSESRLDTDSEVWGLDQTTWELTVWAGETAMRNSIPALRQAGYESISNLPRRLNSAEL